MTPAVVDQALVLFFHVEFLDVGASSGAGKPMAALVFALSVLATQLGCRPHAARAAEGRARLAPAGPRLPLPGPVVCLIVEALCIRGIVGYALLTALTFGLYLLPREAMDTVQTQLIPSGLTTTNNMHAWGVVLHLFERRTPSVTGVFDESLQLRAAMRPLKNFQKRVRWATAAALRRHAKGGRALGPHHRLPRALQLVAEQAFTRIGATLSASSQRG